MDIETQIRATFKDTKKAQERLRIEIDRLDYNNLFIEPNNRGDFFELLADSLLGFDFDKKFKLRLPDRSHITIDNAGEFIRRLVYHTDQKVDIDFFRHYNKLDIVNTNIQDVWHELKFFVFGIYPEALQMSIRISKERLEMKRGDADATDYEEAIKD